MHHHAYGTIAPEARVVVNPLARKHVIVGVTGGIAAYKSADLVRRLRERDAEVRVVMTEAACEFIGALTMQALSGNRVRTALFDAEAEAAMGHIELARWADAVVIAPASADFIARLAHGLADDLLATLCVATAAPLVLAPSMNRQMWASAAVQANCNTLAARGVSLIGPAAGEQACGEVGPGRMSEPAEILGALAALFAPGLLAGVRVLVTAGPTREAIDPVRYISNRSSGRMGYEIAAAAAQAGASVTLVSGPVNLTPPPAVRVLRVSSAAEMLDAVMAALEGTDILIGAAAVADYRAREYSSDKLKKTSGSLTLTLEPTPDVLAQAAARSPSVFTVGFAAETGDLERNAREKLARKSLDVIAANDVAAAGIGFDAEENELHVFWRSGGVRLSRAPKSRIARQLIELIATRFREREVGAVAGVGLKAMAPVGTGAE
jgi:phosphopantothenoylcysteine decarboxylase/phosphopantothenate--cysteine ligase